MKLKYGQTMKIGFAFLSISAFWQLYNSVIPKILVDTYNMNKVWAGAIMALDNVLALFLLPLFGMFSDRCKSPMGKRKPFVLYGTISAVILMQLIPFFDNRYASSGLPIYKFVFIGVLLLLLVSMGIYRSPAIAMMPDVTPKPLRSRANAIINLMGAIGAVTFLIFTSILYTKDSFRDANGHVDYTILFIFVGAVMLVALLVLMFTVNEPKLEEQMHEDSKLFEDDEQDVTSGASGTLSPEVKKSLFFLLCGIFCWFMAFNAVETWFTDFAGHAWNMTLGKATSCLTITSAGMIVTYVPSGYIASKVGRKKTIVAGLCIEVVVFLTAFIYTFIIGEFTPVIYVLFFMLGLAWALINVNSLPMTVDMCAEGDIGKFTGYYYTFSMAAQTVTPVLSGFILEKIGYFSLFIYSAVFMGIAVAMMYFVRHGDAHFTAKKGLEVFENL